MNKKYRVTLTPTERAELESLLARGKADVRRLKHAQSMPRSCSRPTRPKADPLGRTAASPRRWRSGSRWWSVSASALSRRGSRQP